MTCINIKSKEFKALQEATQLPGLILEMQVAEWQQNNSTDNIPTESQLRGVSVDTIVSYNNNPDLQIIGTKEEFTKYTNEVGADATTLQGFEEFTLNIPTNTESLNDEDFDFGSVKPYTKVEIDNKAPELFGDYTEVTKGRKAEHNHNTLFDGLESTSIESVLNVLTAKAKFNDETNAIIDKAKKFKTTASVIVEDNALTGGRLMAFDPATNTIIVNKSVLGEFSTTDIAIAFLHEVAHEKSLNALTNARTSEEIAFRDLMVKFFNSHSEYSDSYGFTSVEEMVAEIYANPEFREEIKMLPATDEKKSVWSKILDSIRRLFGVARTDTNHAIIEAVVSHIDTNHSNFEMLADSPLYFAPHQYSKIDDLSKRINVLNDRILDNIDQLVNYDKNAKVPSRSFTSEQRSEALLELQKLLNEKTISEDITNVLAYVKLAKKVAIAIKKDFEKKFDDFEINNPGSTMSLEDSDFDKIDKYMSLYRLNTDVQGVLIDRLRDVKAALNDKLRKDPMLDPDSLEETKIIDDLNTVLNEFTYLDAEHRRIDALVKSYSQKYVSTLLAKSSNLLPIVEAKFREEIELEYEQKKKAGEDVLGMTKKQYTLHMLSVRADELAQRKQDTAYDIVYSEMHEDISRYDLNWQDPLNIDNSPLIAATINMVSQMRLNIIEQARKSNREIAKIEKEFTAAKNGKPSEKFKNLYEQDADGNYHLKGDYSVSYLHEYNQRLYKVYRRLLDVSGIKKVTADELNSFKHHNSTFIFRTQNSNEFKEGTKVNLSTNDSHTKYNVSVDGIKAHSSVSTTSKEDIESILSVYGFNSLETFKKSNSVLPNSKFAKANPELFNFLTGNGSIEVVQLTRMKITSELRKEAFKDAELRAWTSANQVKRDGKYYPIDKYKTDLSNLTPIERTTLEKFKEISDKHKGTSSLAVNDGRMLHVKYYKLPARNKTQREYVLEGKIKESVKALGREMIQVENDDIEYGEKLNSKGQAIQTVKIHYRGAIEPSQQSLDLFTLYRDEAVNVINFNIKSTYAAKFNAIKEASVSKKYLAKSAKTGNFVQNIFSSRIKEQVIDGDTSNEFKKIAGIIEANVYDVKNYSNGKIGSADFNKILNTVNGTVATVGLAFNYVSGVANVVNGFSQMFLDSFGGRHFTAAQLASAEWEYTKELPEIAADLGRPNKQARVNQMTEIFDVLGSMNPEMQSYLHATLAKRLASRNTLGFMQETGEHMMTGILMYAIMKGIKVTNADGLYVDKEGNVTKDETAATLFDMMEQDVDGNWGFSKKFHGTSHAPTVGFHLKSGQSQVSLLIKKRMHDMFGAYDPGMQPEVYKEAWGKTVLMFKRFLLPGINYRYKGFTSAFKDPAKLTDDDRHFNFATKEFEEGYYTTLVRFFIHGVIGSAKNLSLQTMGHQYNNMSDLQKQNLKKAMIELGMTALILPLLRLLLLSMFDDEEDEALVYSTVYQIRRLEMELSQFRNPTEATKILMNPIASARYIQNVLKASYETATFLNLTPEEDEPVFDWMREDAQGKNVMLKMYRKVIPIWAQFGKDAKQMTNQIDQ